MALHPFVSALLEKLKDQPALSAGSADDARRLVAAGREALGPGPAVERVENLTIRGRAGAIPARLLVPSAAPSGVVVFFHGGGWVVGTLDDYDATTRRLAAETGCAVLSVDYRLAPEAPYPAGLEDCEDALRAVLSGDVPGLPDGPVVVAGDSAGANLATTVCARLSDPSKVAMQVLWYPVTDHDFDRPSYREHGVGLPLTAADMTWFFGQYAPPDRWGDPDISPLRRPSLAGQPPALVVVAEYDVLRDEGEAYAARLSEAGVPVLLRRVDGVTHGFIRLHNLVDVARAEIATAATEIRARLDTRAAERR